MRELNWGDHPIKKYLLCTWGDPSSDPHHPSTKLGTEPDLPNLVTEVIEIGDFQTSLDCQPGRINEL